jgi:Putative 8-oxoguanine DNA glycosylase OGG-like protein
MELNADHFKKFKETYKGKPPEQGKVGQKPSCLFRKLEEPFSNKLYDQQLDRETLRTICHNEKNNIHILICIMAWGEMRFSNVKHLKTILEAEEMRNKLSEIISQLKKSNLSREQAFNLLKESKQKGFLKGIGISYYTKILYSFCSDAYILDQWTAKSMRLLFNDFPITLTKDGLPSPKTSSDDYESFCEAIEELARKLKWKPEQVEIGLFGKGLTKPLCWRDYIYQILPQ